MGLNLPYYMHWWAKQYPVKDAADEIGVSRATAIQVYGWMRDVCSTDCVTLTPNTIRVVVSIVGLVFTHTK